VPLYALYAVLKLPSDYINIIFNIKDNDINLHGHVSVDKEAAQIIDNNLGTIGSNIGLAGSSYFSFELYNNIDKYVDTFIQYKNK
jgi:hypothetical protein